MTWAKAGTTKHLGDLDPEWSAKLAEETMNIINKFIDLRTATAGMTAHRE